MSRAVTVWCFETVADVACCRERQTPFRYRRPGADAIVHKRLSTLHPCRAKYRHTRSSLSRSWACVATPAWSEKPSMLATRLLPSSSIAGSVCKVPTVGALGEHLAARIRAGGYAISDGMPNDGVHWPIMFWWQVQVGVLGITH